MRRYVPSTFAKVRKLLTATDTSSAHALTSPSFPKPSRMQNRKGSRHHVKIVPLPGQPCRNPKRISYNSMRSCPSRVYATLAWYTAFRRSTNPPGKPSAPIAAQIHTCAIDGKAAAKSNSAMQGRPGATDLAGMPYARPAASMSITLFRSCLPGTKPRWTEHARLASTFRTLRLVTLVTSFASLFLSDNGRVSAGCRSRDVGSGSGAATSFGTNIASCALKPLGGSWPAWSALLTARSVSAPFFPAAFHPA